MLQTDHIGPVLLRKEQPLVLTLWIWIRLHRPQCFSQIHSAAGVGCERLFYSSVCTIPRFDLHLDPAPCSSVPLISVWEESTASASFSERALSAVHAARSSLDPEGPAGRRQRASPAHPGGRPKPRPWVLTRGPRGGLSAARPGSPHPAACPDTPSLGPALRRGPRTLGVQSRAEVRCRWMESSHDRR